MESKWATCGERSRSFSPRLLPIFEPKRKKIDPISLACNQAARGTKSAALSATDIQLGPRKNHNRPVESIPYSSAAIEGIKAIRAESKAGSRSRLGASRGYDSMILFIKRHPPPPPIHVSHVPQCSTCIIDSPSFYFPSIKELLLVEPWQRKRVLSGRIFFILSSVNTALFSENPFLNATNLNKGEERVTKSFEFMKRSVGLFVEFWCHQIDLPKFSRSLKN